VRRILGEQHVGPTTLATSDFVALLRERYPHLLPPVLQPSFSGPPDEALPGASVGMGPRLNRLLPHGTTVLALRDAEGVVLAGDRQATMGYEVADRHIQKVYTADDYSAIAIAGIAGPCMQMAKLLTTQLEFYEKVEGSVLSLEGKANYLSLLLRQNLAAAMQGLVVVPLFAGYDLRRGEGRIFKYDVTGGRYEETEYYAIGSGGKDARGTLRKWFRPGLPREEALEHAVEALMDAGEEDIATGTVDFVRGIYPTVKVISREGTRDIPDDDVRRVAERIVERRRPARSRHSADEPPQ
jgi:proteasome beta subunit